MYKTKVMITNKSPKAKFVISRFGIVLNPLCRETMYIILPLPARPAMKTIMLNAIKHDVPQKGVYPGPLGGRGEYVVLLELSMVVSD